jgi:hypothetical protein
VVTTAFGNLDRRFVVGGDQELDPIEAELPEGV